MKYNQIFFLALFMCICQFAFSQHFTEKNYEFIEYKGFKNAHSTWGSVGFNPVNNCVYIGVTNHRDSVALFEYNPKKEDMKLLGFLQDLSYLRDFQWQAKMHSKIVFDRKGDVFFGTDAGESRGEHLNNHPHGYGGGIFMKWDPKANKLTNLGMGIQYQSIKDIDIDPQSGLIYGITYPQSHFLVYDPSKNDMRDMGRLGSGHTPRIIFTDWWGNCYYVDWRQRLVKYEKSTGSLVFAEESLPAFPGTPGERIITGITAYSKDVKNGIIYLITYGAKILAFHPTEKGIGKVTDLGGVFDFGKKTPYDHYVPNLNIGDNGKLYYIVGGHGNYVKDRATLLVEFDPNLKTYTLLAEFPLNILCEATGCDVRDKEGNLYFVCRYDKEGARNDGAVGSAAVMFKFNPDKEVRK